MKLKKRKGFALMTVLFVMIILSIFFISIMAITGSNTKQVTLQEDNLRAYYLARSGIDIAYAALMREDEGGILKSHKFIEGTEEYLIHEDLELQDDDNSFGFVDIKISKDDNEVKISAIAKTANGPGSSALSLYIDQIDYTRTRWVKE